MKAHPEAKVVLVEIDIEHWYKSFKVMIREMYSPVINVLRIPDPQILGPVAAMYYYVLQRPPRILLQSRQQGGITSYRENALQRTV